jgi:UDP-2,3-diacylglucosamine pyrophosphatase LpxH
MPAALRKLLAEYKVPVVFSGHIHAQDISADPSKKYPTKEIVSASFSETPGIYGVVTLTKDTFSYHTQKQNSRLTSPPRNVLTRGC